jgi:hypothetical protein
MQCHVNTIVPKSRRIILMETHNRVRAGNCLLAISHPDDFKGLREWVIAKRRSEVNPEHDCQQIYIAPWRIG